MPTVLAGDILCKGVPIRSSTSPSTFTTTQPLNADIVWIREALANQAKALQQELQARDSSTSTEHLGIDAIVEEILSE